MSVCRLKAVKGWTPATFWRVCPSTCLNEITMLSAGLFTTRLSAEETNQPFNSGVSDQDVVQDTDASEKLNLLHCRHKHSFHLIGFLSPQGFVILWHIKHIKMKLIKNNIPFISKWQSFSVGFFCSLFCLIPPPLSCLDGSPGTFAQRFFLFLQSVVYYRDSSLAP